MFKNSSANGNKTCIQNFKGFVEIRFDTIRSAQRRSMVIVKEILRGATVWFLDAK